MTPYKSTWQSRLPEDEIARQQAIREQLQPGCTVILQLDGTPLGEFIYTGVWDTMHTFYPSAEAVESALPALMSDGRRRYLRRDLRGRSFVQLPYTILADTVTSITHTPRRNDP